MRIKTVELKNVGQFEKLERQLDTGLVGIVGRNGAGKTTFVNAIYAALTNDFSRLAAVKANAIRNGSSGSSYIRIKGTHNNQDFELTRYLRPNKQELVTPERTYTANADIVGYFENQLNISKTTIDNYVFVDQWSMFDFILQNESERARLFQHICGLTKALDIYKACDGFLARNKLAVVIDNRAELELALADLAKQIQEVTYSMTEARKTVLSVEIMEDYRQAIAAYQRKPELQAAWDKLEVEVTEINNNLQNRIVPELERLQNDWEIQTTARAEHESTKQKAEALVTAYKNQNVIRQLLSQKQTHLQLIQTKAAELKVRQQSLKSPENLIAQAALNDKQSKLWELERQIADCAKILKNKICPVCQQDIPNYEETQKEKENAETLRFKLAADLQNAISFWQQVEEFKQKQNQYSTEHNRLEADITDLNAKLGKPVSEKSHDQAVTFLQQLKEIDDTIATCEREQVKKKQEKISAEKQLITLQTQKSRLTDQLTACPKAVNHLVEELALHERSKSEYDRASGLLTGLKANQTATQASYDRLLKQLANNEKRNAAIAVVEQVKDVFHWNKLPKLVTTANLNRLCTDINEILSSFDNPFYVEANEELSFQAYFPGRESVSARQLSGGQKVSLAIAFRIALDRIFGGNVGLLCLDEPTVGLDADNLKNFHEILQTLALNAHRQVLMITHNEGFSSCFNQTINLHD